MIRKSREAFKTMHNVFDAFTERNIFKLSSQNHIDAIESPVQIGKEANVFTAKKDDETRIVKIYRLQTCDFNRMFDYIKFDPRYIGLKSQRRKVIFAWAQREFRNLLKAREAGVRVPTPYAILHNILVMEFIGHDKPAKQLKDQKPENPEEFFKMIIKQINLLYKAGIVHADLSGFNILILDEKPIFIDMSQATPLNNPNAQDYLKRDIKNICTLAKKWEVGCNEKEIYEKITGLSYS